MRRLIVSLVAMLVFASIGYYIGFMIHGESWRIAIPVLSGALGGFGIGFVGFDVGRKLRSLHARGPDSANFGGSACTSFDCDKTT